MKPQVTQLATKHETAVKRSHAHSTETASSHQLSTKQSSNVRTITLLKRKSDCQKTTSRRDTGATLYHSNTLNTGTRPNSANISGFLKTTFIISSSSPYKNASKKFNLCVKEKFLICRPELSTHSTNSRI